MRPASPTRCFSWFACGVTCAAASGACTLVNEPEPTWMRWPVQEEPGSEAGVVGSSASTEVDAAAVLAALKSGAFREDPLFTHATRAPYPSSAAQGSWVDEWVSTTAYAAYSTVRPDETGSGADMPVGTIVVRVVLDADGGATELTVMAKGPPGYNPALGDWWFGVTDPDGTPAQSDGGAMMGRLDGCYACHLPRSADDYLFGVPVGDRP